MFRTILVPLDGSPLGEHALPYAAALARATGARLVAVHGAKDSVTRRQAEAVLGRVAEHLWQHGITVEAHVRVRTPGAAILSAVEAWGADLVAMSTHGRSGLGRWLYGSVADHVLRHAAVPVLLIPARCERPWPPDSDGVEGKEAPGVLVLLDGSPLAEAAIGPARALAAALGARLHLVRSAPAPVPRYAAASALPDAVLLAQLGPLAPPVERIGGSPRAGDRMRAWYARDLGLDEELPLDGSPAHAGELAQARAYLDELAGRLAASGRAVEVHAISDAPAVAAIGLAERHTAGAIVLCTHGRSGLARLALGSVATDVLRRTSVPLLLVGPVAAARLPYVPAAGTPQAAPERRASVAV